jgi:hypothetical protein
MYTITCKSHGSGHRQKRKVDPPRLTVLGINVPINPGYCHCKRQEVCLATALVDIMVNIAPRRTAASASDA